MVVFQFYAVTCVILIAAIAILLRQGRKENRFTHALFALLGWQLLGFGLTFFVGLPQLAELNIATEWVITAVQVISWGILVWGLGFDWRLVFIFFLLAVAAVVLDSAALQGLFTWGFVMAIPFATVADLRQRTSLPIFAITPMAQNLKPVTSDSHITAEMVNSGQPILECLTDGVLICGPSGLIYSANQATSVILGIAEDDLVGRPISDILAHFPVLGEVGQELRERRLEINGRTIEGRMNPIYDKQSAVQGTVVILRDITSEYRSEMARDNLLTTVSNELRTPLTAIKGYIELLQTGSGGELSETQLAYMETIQRNVAKMVQLINNLIFTASVKGGRMEYKSGLVHLPQLIHQIARELEPTAAQRKQAIHLDIDSRLHTIDADPIHVAMILEELMTNGLKHGREQGALEVIATLEANEFAVISIMDDGFGIAETDQAHIFEDFYRAEWHEEQVRAGGIGIGLSIVRALVEAYNGRIWFESYPNQGTTFTFILPTSQMSSQNGINKAQSEMAVG